MATTASENTSDFKPVPSGTHPARCFGVIDLGTQIPKNTSYKPSHKVLVLWELPHEVYEVDGKTVPMTTMKRYTLSVNKKATLRKDLDSWRGRGFTDEEAKAFQVANLINAPCMLSITHTPKDDGPGVWVNIASVSGIPRGMQVPELTHKRVHWELEQGKDATFNALPEWMRDVINKCVEWCPTDTAAFAPTDAPEKEVIDDEVPF